jgi:hypothetical protein
MSDRRHVWGLYALPVAAHPAGYWPAHVEVLIIDRAGSFRYCSPEVIMDAVEAFNVDPATGKIIDTPTPPRECSAYARPYAVHDGAIDAAGILTPGPAFRPLPLPTSVRRARDWPAAMRAATGKRTLPRLVRAALEVTRA